MKNPFLWRSPAISFLSIMVLLIAAFVAGGGIWRDQFSVQYSAWALGTAGLLTVIVWRGLICRAKLPRTGLDILLLAFLAVSALSTLLSPDPRQGLERLLTLGAFILIFYLLVDAFDSGLDQAAARAALLTVSGFVLAFAAIETTLAYRQWWQAVGSFSTQPPFPYRFVGLLGHPNAFMALANLAAPFALAGFFTHPRFAGRLAYALWLGFYLAVLPFSSSRGGWLGMAAWVGMLALYLFWQRRAEATRLLQRFQRSALAWTGSFFGLGAGAYLAYQLWLYFAAHPSHGGNPFAGRGYIWAVALKVWQSSPILGAGLGRFGFGWLEQNPASPPAFWGLNAHSLPFNVLAELGLTGALVLLLTVAAGVRILWRQVNQNPPERSAWWTAAASAGAISLAVQSVFDQPTNFPAVVIAQILVGALALTSNPNALPRWRRIPLSGLVLPGLALIGVQGWVLWSYQPLVESLALARQGDWPAAARLASESAQRDPALAFYHSQAGLIWANAYQDSRDMQDLARARAHLRQSLDLEPAVTPFRADLAVLDWQAGERQAALKGMTRAASERPVEPSYLLNLGFFYEEMGRAEEARESYLQALNLTPGWAGHPFWDATGLRRDMLRRWLVDHPDAPKLPEYLEQARQTLKRGDLEGARRWLATSRWVGEVEGDLLVLEGLLAEQNSDQAAAESAYRRLLALTTSQDIPLSAGFARTYNVWLYGRGGLDSSLVPGYHILWEENGQFEALEKLAAWEGSAGLTRQALEHLRAGQAK